MDSTSSAQRARDGSAPAPAPAPTDVAEPATRVLRRFRSVFNAVKTHFQQVEKLAGVGGAQLWALSVIRQQPGIGVSGLAQAMDIHQTTASNLVKSLLGSGLAVSSRSESDRRATVLHLTPDGEQVLLKAPGPFSGVLPRALQALDAETLKRLDTDLGTLLALLQPDQRAAQTPLAEL